MSISTIQKQKLFETIARSLFASGEKPSADDILGGISRFAARNPIGQPLLVPLSNIATGVESNVDDFNTALAHLAYNVEVAYEASQEQIDQVLMLTTILRSGLERLRNRREKLISRIDDLLLSQTNSDGYFYSVSDSFTDLNDIDLGLTTAFIDTVNGNVAIPYNSDLTMPIPDSKISRGQLRAVANNQLVQHRTTSPLSNAFDGLTNTYWITEVRTTEPKEIMLTVQFGIADLVEPVEVSRIEINPYCIEPVQIAVATQVKDGSVTGPRPSEVIKNVDEGLAALGFTGYLFGDKFVTVNKPVVFQDQLQRVSNISILMRKTQPDREVLENGVTRYVYIFGARDILISKHVYDNVATMVTTSIGLPDDLMGDHAIDTVSLVTDTDVPTDSEIRFYVAADTDSDSNELGDFTWTEIEPITGFNSDKNSLVKFGGAFPFSQILRYSPEEGEGEIIPLQNGLNIPPADLNPIDSIPGIEDAYRLFKLNQDIIQSSIRLEEGVNTTRILYRDLDEAAVNGLDQWTDYINGTNAVTEIFGRIDTAFGFFDGSDVGEDEKSIYVETFIYLENEIPPLLKKLIKVTDNALVWDVRAFLNGNELAYLPAATKEAVVPWKFKKGLNHIALLINIPRVSNEYIQVYNGQIDLMAPDKLFDFGAVRLTELQYVDPLHMQYNQTGQPNSFTIYDNEIIMRKQPTDNYRISYAKKTKTAPSSIRLRADLIRNSNNPYVTPILDKYRVRFTYS